MPRIGKMKGKKEVRTVIGEHLSFPNSNHLSFAGRSKETQ